MQKDIKIFISEEYNTSKQNIFDLISNGTLFKLTGAETVTLSFKKFGSFKLSFKDRGVIHGTFEEIIPDKRVSFKWNVSGFGRDDEMNTLVVISILKMDDGAIIEIQHSGIRTKVSANAKQRAWTEIARELKKEVVQLV